MHNSVFNTTEHCSIFTFYTARYFGDAKTNKKLKEEKDQRTSSQIKLHVEEVNKRVLEMKVGLITNQYSDHEVFPKKNEVFEIRKSIDLENLVSRGNLT